MTTVTTTTYAPAAQQPAYAPAAVAQPVYGTQPAYVPVANVAQAPIPAVASSHTTGSSLPGYSALPAAVIPSRPAHQIDGYHTVLGDYFRARGEYDYYLNALKMNTPTLNKARHKLNLPVGWDLSKNELEMHQVFKKKYLKKFKKEIIRLVEQQKIAARSVRYPVTQTVPAVSVPVGTVASSIPAAPLVHTV